MKSSAPDSFRIPSAFCSATHGHCRLSSTDRVTQRITAPDLAPKRERPPELDSNLRPRLRAPTRVQHHAQDAIEAKPGMPKAGVGVVHLFFGPPSLPTCVRQ